MNGEGWAGKHGPYYVTPAYRAGNWMLGVQLIRVRPQGYWLLDFTSYGWDPHAARDYQLWVPIDYLSLRLSREKGRRLLQSPSRSVYGLYAELISGLRCDYRGEEMVTWRVNL